MADWFEPAISLDTAASMLGDVVDVAGFRTLGDLWEASERTATLVSDVIEVAEHIKRDQVAANLFEQNLDRIAERVEKLAERAGNGDDVSGELDKLATDLRDAYRV